MTTASRSSSTWRTRTTDDAVAVVAKSVGLGSDASGDLVAAAAVALTAHDYLLVLDNCDRVGDVVGELVSSCCGRLRRSASWPPAARPSAVRTRRSTRCAPLGVEGAEPRRGAALPGPGGGGRRGADGAGRRTSRAEVCQRLDGLPLAIELAAARSRHLSLGELAARLAHGFGALDRGGTGRHSTLAAAFAWTWDLLEPREQDVLVPAGGAPEDLRPRPRRGGRPARGRPTSRSAWPTARW